jgi:hypothetical protein|tara:strand:- start:723 stop:1100 length:378 start_codon:yes stop_codon:yes gene_type:complete
MRAKEFIVKEHRAVFRRNPNTGHINLFWRCETGQRKGRTVPDVSNCNQALDVAKSNRFKKVRARTHKMQAFKSNRTKTRSRASRTVKKLNKWRNETPKRFKRKVTKPVRLRTPGRIRQIKTKGTK